MEGSGGREGRGPMKSVNSGARKVASPPLGKRAVATTMHVGNMWTRSASLVLSLPVRQSAGLHFTHTRTKVLKNNNKTMSYVFIIYIYMHKNMIPMVEDVLSSLYSTQEQRHMSRH